MRFETTDKFRNDVKRLRRKPEHWEMFQEAIRAFSKACDAYVERDEKSWPSDLRVKPLKGAPGIWEMTWNFASPDGRATFEWITIDATDKKGRTTQVPAVRWRRCGTHAIFRSP